MPITHKLQVKWMEIAIIINLCPRDILWMLWMFPESMRRHFADDYGSFVRTGRCAGNLEKSKFQIGELLGDGNVYFPKLFYNNEYMTISLVFLIGVWIHIILSLRHAPTDEELWGDDDE